MKITRQKIKWWGLVILWMAFIFYLSHQPSLSSGLQVYWDLILRKIAHITEYAILTFLLIKALGEHNLTGKQIILLSIIVAVLYAISDEYHQTFIFGRQGAVKDVLIDSVGILFTAWRCKKKMLK